MGLRELAEEAAALGHGGIEVARTESGRRWSVSCSCGWGAPFSDGRPTITRATEAEGILTAMWHIRTAVKTHRATLRANGVSSPHVVRPVH